MTEDDLGQDLDRAALQSLVAQQRAELQAAREQLKQTQQDLARVRRQRKALQEQVRSAEPAVTPGAFRRAARSARRRVRRLRDRSKPAGERGVNVLGYMTGEFGLGEVGRVVLAAVHDAGLPHVEVVEEATSNNRNGHPLPRAAVVGAPTYPVSIVCVTADLLRTTVNLYPEIAEDRYVIGMWAWELEEFPQQFHRAFDLVDEIWTISDYCRRAIAAVAPVPVHAFPIPVRDPYTGDPPPRSSDGTTRFLTVFDYNSDFDRKNPLAAVAAFKEAFKGRDGVELVIKSINAGTHPEERQRLLDAIGGDARIALREDYLDAPALHALFASADCYVSLHRAEGFGLTVAEAMARGLAVIVTDYSSTTEFVGPDAGWRIPFELVPVGPGKLVYPETARWADADVAAAAQAMRSVFADPDEARRRGEAARLGILACRTPAKAAAWAADRVAAAHERRRGLMPVAR